LVEAIEANQETEQELERLRQWAEDVEADPDL
jgi:hypothetical protein